MLFNKKIEPCCSYCRFGVKISDDEVMCLKKGVVSAFGKCRRFKYDPLRREPPAHVLFDAKEFSEKDFSLE